jgi:hypothetical protein
VRVRACVLATNLSEVARGAQGAFLGDDWVDTCIEHPQQKLQRFEARARVPPRQRVDPNEHDRARDAAAERGTEADGVRYDYVALEQLNLFGSYDFVLEGAKARSDTIDNAFFTEKLLHCLGSTHNCSAC